MLWVEIFSNYISRCSKSEASYVNEMLALIKRGGFESRICISILRFAYDQPYLFQQDAVIMRNGSKLPNFNFLNKFRKPNVVTFRKQMNCCQFKKWSFESRQWAITMWLNRLANRLSTLANWTLAKRLVSETTCYRNLISSRVTCHTLSRQQIVHRILETSSAVLDFLNFKSNFPAEKDDTVLNDESTKLYLPVNEK